MYDLAGLLSVAECISRDLGILIQHSVAGSIKEEELQKLQFNVGVIKGLLLGARRNQQATHPTVKIWLMRLRHVLYDAEDLVDLLSTRLRIQNLTTGTFTRMVKKVSPKFIFNREWIDEAKTIRRRLEDAANMFNSLNICLLTARDGEEERVELSSDDLDSEIYRSECWYSFTELAFGPGNLNSKPDSIVKIAKSIFGKIYRKAEEPEILALATVLRHKEETEAEWRSVHDEVATTVEQNKDGIVQAIAKINYNHLPSYLKLCCNYCALFPYWTVFPKDFLVAAWMASGFIIQPTNPSDQQQPLEDIAYQYLKELVSASILKPFEDEEENHDYIDWCQLTRSAYDLAKEEVGEEIIHTDSTASGFHAGNFHVCLEIEQSSWITPPSLLRAQRLRTFSTLPIDGGFHTASLFNIFKRLKYLRVLDLQDVIRTETIPSYDTTALDRIFRRFKYLRVLVLTNVIGTETIPSSVCELKLLRYINLAGNEEELLYLPESITELVNLQTLALNQCRNLVRLPRDLGKLLNLRLLDITGCDSLKIGAPNGKKKAAFSRELSQFRFIKARLESKWYRWDERTDVLTLQGFPKSRHQDQASASTSLFGVQLHPDLLQAQELSRTLEVLEVRYYYGERIPICELDHKHSSSFSCLAKITITDCRKCKRLFPFHLFPSLEVLVLCNMDKLQYVEQCSRHDLLLSSSPSSFRRLKVLQLSHLPNLTGWSMDIAALELNPLNYHLIPTFPHLHKLIISGCPNLTSMPSVLSVEQLELNDVREMLLEKLMTQRVVGEDAESSRERPVISGLQHLKIARVDGLRSLPGWMRNLTELQWLEIEQCNQFSSVPMWMPSLTALQHLAIRKCPAIEEASLRKPIENQPAGSNWHLVEHIPDINIIDNYLIDHKGEEEEEEDDSGSSHHSDLT